MVTRAQIEPVVETIASATGTVRADALGALVELDLTEDQWREVSPALQALVEDPTTDLAGLADPLVRLPLASVRRRLYDVAAHADPRSRLALLSALRQAGDDEVTADLVAARLAELQQSAPGAETEAVAALASLPIEDGGVSAGQLRPVLASTSPDAALWAAVALARLGDTDPLDALLRRLADGQVDGFLGGNPFAAYDDLAVVRPLPAPLRDHLDAALARLDPSQAPHVCLVVLWALTGSADAQGSPLVTESAPLDSVAPPTSPPASPPPTATVERAREAASVLLDPDTEFFTPSDAESTAVLGSLPSHEVGPLLTEALARAPEWTQRGVPEFVIGNHLAAVAGHLPRGTGVDLGRVVSGYTGQRSPIPEDQLGWVLARSLDGDLLDQFGALMRRDDTGERAIAARLLRVTLGQRGLPAPVHGDGPTATAAAPTPERLIEDEGWAMAEPPATAGAEPDLAAPAAAPSMAPPPAPSMAPPPMPAPTTAVAPAEPSYDPALRRVHAELFEEQGRRRREHTVRPGVRHLVSVRIGPGAAGRGTIATPLPEGDIRWAPGGARLQVVLVTDSAAGPAMTSRPLVLKRKGSSATVDLPLDVPAGVKELRASVLVLQDANVLQSGRLRAPVAEKDVPVAGRSWGFVRDTDIAAPVRQRRKRPKLDTSLSFHVGGDGDALLVQRSGEKKVLSVNDMLAFRDAVVTTLAESLLQDDVEGTKPGSDQQVALLRRLARRGYSLYQQLAPQLADAEIGPRIQLVSSEHEVVPLEFVYDYGLPSKDATLCAHWRTALSKGRCRCKPHQGDETTVCPLGFWGLRFIIERQLATDDTDDAAATASAGQLRPGNDTLPSLRRVLFAATSKVDNESRDQRQRTFTHLTGLLGAGVVQADTWAQWHQALATQRPGLILSLPHTEEVEGLIGLEIGDDFREVAGLTDDYVVPAGATVGPVVLLLGCSTATADVSWQSAVANFRRRGASLVVGTLVETLGRQTAPMARVLADQLWGPDRAKGKTMGEALQIVRRRLVASGATLGMSLVVFGQTAWIRSSDD